MGPPTYRCKCGRQTDYGIFCLSCAMELEEIEKEKSVEELKEEEEQEEDYE